MHCQPSHTPPLLTSHADLFPQSWGPMRLSEVNLNITQNSDIFPEIHAVVRQGGQGGLPRAEDMATTC